MVELWILPIVTRILTTKEEIISFHSWPELGTSNHDQGPHYYGRAWMLPIITRALTAMVECGSFQSYLGPLQPRCRSHPFIYNHGSRYCSWAQIFPIMTTDLTSMMEVRSFQLWPGFPHNSGAHIFLIITSLPPYPTLTSDHMTMSTVTWPWPQLAKDLHIALNPP